MSNLYFLRFLREAQGVPSAPRIKTHCLITIFLIQILDNSTLSSPLLLLRNHNSIALFLCRYSFKVNGVFGLNVRTHYQWQTPFPQYIAIYQSQWLPSSSHSMNPFGW